MGNRTALSNRLGLAVLVSALIAAPILACSIPVFRYALENWQPDRYPVIVVSQGPLDAEQQALVQRLVSTAQDEKRPANMVVVPSDLSEVQLEETLAAEFPEQRVPVWVKESIPKLAGDLSVPKVVALYPNVWDRAAWVAPLEDATVERLVTSPLRAEVLKRLVDGQSAVWVLIDGDDKAANDKAWETLETELKSLNTEIELPDRDDIVTDDEYRPDVEIELRVEFSAVRLSQDDGQEAASRSMLLGTEDDLRGFSEPIAIPIYGRGRTYFALVGEGITADNMRANGEFICGACSCQVKRDNPGMDLLLAENWDQHVKGSAMPEVVLPDLVGIGGFETSTPELDESTALASAANARETTVADDTERTEPSDRDSAAESTSSDEADEASDAANDSDADVAEVAAASDDAWTSYPPEESGSRPQFSILLLGGILGAVVVAVVALAFMTSVASK